jgi:hypothetical protein
VPRPPPSTRFHPGGGDATLDLWAVGAQPGTSAQPRRPGTMEESMSDNPQGPDQEQPEEPTTDDLQEPSVAKDPGEEPKAPETHDPEPDHEAVGIGVIDSPNADAEGQG